MGMFRAALLRGSVDANGDPQPWFTYPCIEYLRQRDLSGMDVFEFGSGYGTAYFSKHAKSVTSAENDPVWRNKVLAMTRSRASIILCRKQPEYLAAINARNAYDVIVIDGFWRLECAKVVVKKLKHGGMIILDNAEKVEDDGKAAADYLSKLDLLRVNFFGFSPFTNKIGDTSIFFDLRTP